MTGRRRWLGFIVVGLLIALAVSLFSPLASSKPDGLETVAEDEGFREREEEPRWEIIPDYTFPGVTDERVATILAGVTGVVLVAAIMFGLGYLLQSTARSRRGETGGRDLPPVSGGG